MQEFYWIFPENSDSQANTNCFVIVDSGGFKQKQDYVVLFILHLWKYVVRVCIYVYRYADSQNDNAVSKRKLNLYRSSYESGCICACARAAWNNNKRERKLEN